MEEEEGEEEEEEEEKEEEEGQSDCEWLGDMLQCELRTVFDCLCATCLTCLTVSQDSCDGNGSM